MTEPELTPQAATDTQADVRLRGDAERDPLDDVAGIFDGLYPPGYLDELRNEWR